MYESSKFFTLRHPPSRQELTTQVSSLFSLPGSSSKEGESGCESAPSSQCKDSRSSHGDEEDRQGVEDSDENDAEKSGKEARPVKAISPSAIGPSVRKLVRRFSRKESGLERRSTFTSSSNSIHDEGRGSGIRVPLKQSGHRFEVPFVLTTWNKRNRRRTTSCTFSSASSSSSSDYEHNSCIELGGRHSSACTPFFRSLLARSISNDNFHLDTERPSPSQSFHVRNLPSFSFLPQPFLSFFPFTTIPLLLSFHH